MRIATTNTFLCQALALTVTRNQNRRMGRFIFGCSVAGIGLLILVVAGLHFYDALRMDTTVEIWGLDGVARSVHNIPLAEQRSTKLTVSGIALIVSLFMVLFGLYCMTGRSSQW